MSAFSLAVAVNALSFSTVTRRRREPAGFGEDGIAIPPSETSAPISGSMTPMPDKELVKETSGARTRGGYRFITTGDLRTADRAGGFEADHVDADGVVYEVMKVGDWMTHGFIDVVMAKVEP